MTPSIATKAFYLGTFYHDATHMGTRVLKNCAIATLSTREKMIRVYNISKISPMPLDMIFILQSLAKSGHCSPVAFDRVILYYSPHFIYSKFK